MLFFLTADAAAAFGGDDVTDLRGASEACPRVTTTLVRLAPAPNSCEALPLLCTVAGEARDGGVNRTVGAAALAGRPGDSEGRDGFCRPISAARAEVVLWIASWVGRGMGGTRLKVGSWAESWGPDVAAPPVAIAGVGPAYRDAGTAAAAIWLPDCGLVSSKPPA